MMPRNTLRALLLASVILLFVDLGGSSIWDANEAFYVETPRQMVLTGDYVNPSFNGQPRFNKPVLSYWVVAGFYKVLGVSVTSERVAIAFGALMIIAATFVIGRTVADEDTGVLAALIIASAPRVMLWSRRIFIDIYFTSFLALALMAFVLARARPAQRKRWWLLMYTALGLAMLTKGPVALLLPALVLIVDLVWSRRFADLRQMQIPAGLLIIVAIVLPWYAAVYLQHGWTRIYEFFVTENLNRYAETYGAAQGRGIEFYIPVLLTDLLPWSLFLPAAAIAAWRSRRQDLRVLLIWLAVFVGVFTFSRSKQDLYIFPVVPAVAVLIATALTNVDLQSTFATMRRWLRAGAAVTAIELIVLGAVAIWISRLVPQISQAAVVGAALVVGGIAAAFAVFRARTTTLVVTLASTAVVVNWLLVVLVMRPFEQFKPVAPMSEWLRTHASSSTVVAQYKMPFPSMAFYLQRPYTELFDVEAMKRLIDRESSVYVLVQPQDFAELTSVAGGRVCTIDKRPRPLIDAKLSEIVAQKLPQVLLVGVKGACQ